MRSILLNILLFLFVAYAQAQNSESQEKNRHLQTEVFVLDTKEPSQLSIIRVDEDNKNTKPAQVTKLEVKNNRFTSFKIININPLRYSYYINDELVTQFMESKSAGLGSTLTGGNAVMNDISNLPIFDLSTSKTEEKKAEIYTEIKVQIKTLKDALGKNAVNYFIAKDNLVKLGKADTLKHLHTSSKEYLEALAEFKKYQSEYEDLSKQLEDKLQESLNVVNKQNEKSYDIIDNLGYNSTFSNVSLLDNSLNATIGAIKRNAKSLSISNKLLDSLANLLPKLVSSFSNNNYYYYYYNKLDQNSSDIIKEIKSRLDDLHYYSQIISSLSTSSTYYDKGDSRQKIIEEIININEFISTKKEKGLEGFLLNSYSEIGKLLQLQYIGSSRDINTITGKNFLDDSDLVSIKEKGDNLKEVFDFIQSVSADFSIITKSLKVDDYQFRELVTNIKLNYAKLLDYLKKFDYLCKQNTYDFSLPNHNNLQNVDLVRYKIDRKDLITQSKQSYTYDIWVKGGIKVDFSVGIMGSRIVDQEYNKVEYFTPTSIPATTSKDTLMLFRKDRGAYNFAFGGMVNVYRRNGANWINWGGSVGVVYANNQKVQFIIGPSLQFGKTERLILHGGVSFGFMQELDKSQLNYIDKGNGYVVRGDITNFNIPMVDRFSVRSFIGISYNLSKKNALQAVSSQAGIKKYEGEMPTNSTTSK